MPAVTFTLISVCAGGGHADVDATINGATRRLHLNVDDIRRGLGTYSDEELTTAASIILNVHVSGKTRNQIGTEFQSSVVVTI